MAGAATLVLLGGHVERNWRRMRVEDRYDKWANTVSGSNIS
jgi:hypothetical protein